MNKPPGGWPLASQVAIAVVVTIALSIWQVGRGFDKLAQKDAYEAKLVMPPVTETDWLATEAEYRKVQLIGRYDPIRHFIIENRIQNGRSGYWIFSVFNTEHDRYLVNRGWVSIQSNVRIDPDFDTPLESVTVIGVAWPNPVMRTSNSMEQTEWPVRMRDVDIGQMARMTSARAIEMRLVNESATALKPAPLQVEFSTAMHWGYAAQWLLIGGLVIGGYWFFVIRKEREDAEV